MNFKDFYNTDTKVKIQEKVEPRTNAYWLSPNKEIIAVSNTHIDTVIRSPELFGFDWDYIEKVAEENGGRQELRDGGKARNVLMTEMLNKGWVRVRKVTRPTEFWTIQLENGMGGTLPRQVKNTIVNWAEQMILMDKARGNDAVKVLDTKGNLLFGGEGLVKDQKTINDIYLYVYNF